MTPEAFRDVCAGHKKAESRRADRGFSPRDTVLLNEYDPITGYTGRSVLVRVTHVQKGFAIPEGYVMLSIEVVPPPAGEGIDVVRVLVQPEARDRCDHRIPYGASSVVCGKCGNPVEHNEEEREWRRALLTPLDSTFYAIQKADRNPGVGWGYSLEDLRRRFRP
jgi:hypothetical protein